jgi:putative transposase
MRCAGTTVTLPRLGTMHTHESARKLARRLDNGSARILSATVSRTAQRWFVSFTVQVQGTVPAAHARPGTAIGVDLGVKTLITGADDAGNVITIDGPRALRSSMRRLQRASRAHARKKPGSANRRKHAARLARIHARVSSVRADALHKATTALARRYETVVAEDLQVTGMIRNRRLGRAVADQGFGEARRMLAYKTVWNGGILLIADRWFPSSKTCSACGWRKPSLTLAERTFSCDNCGHVEDRDVNAARNLVALAASGAERLNACRAQVSPGAAGHRAQSRDAGKTQEPGTAHAGKTGTAGPQDPAVIHVLINVH